MSKKNRNTEATTTEAGAILGKTQKPVKEREINRIGYVGNHLSNQRLKAIGKSLTGVAKATFRDWFKEELRPHRRAVARKAKAA